MTRTRGRACTGKVQHETKAAAEEAIWSLVHNRGAIRGRLHAYACEFCGWFHVGNKPRKRR